MSSHHRWLPGADEEVACIACGRSVTRSAAREYDKHGARWDRTDKTFEYLCTDCHGDCCHQPRDGLEARLVSAGAGEVDRDTFLRRFCATQGEHPDLDS